MERPWQPVSHTLDPAECLVLFAVRAAAPIDALSLEGITGLKRYKLTATLKALSLKGYVWRKAYAKGTRYIPAPVPND